MRRKRLQSTWWRFRVVVLIMVAGLGLYLLVRPRESEPTATQPNQTATPSPLAKTVKAYLESGLTNYAKPLEEYLQTKGYLLTRVSTDAEADLLIQSKAMEASDSVIAEGDLGEPVTKLSTAEVVKSIKQPIAYLHLQTGILQDSERTELKDLLAKVTLPNPESWTLKALGDIIPGRSVYEKVTALQDQTAPYKVTSSYTKNADLTLADLECPLSDTVTHATEGMVFSAPTKAASGLQAAGIDAVSISNNHVYNKGAKVFAETLATLDQYKIPYFGGGANQKAAHAPYIMTVKGIKIALLGYSSIVGDVEAGENKSGMATLEMAPWDPFAEGPVVKMEADIKAAKAQADLVMVYYHWGAEYTHTANPDQRTVAHRAIDAGADLILGTHPHWVQGLEWYHGKLITYSLGNFVFDQEWSIETKQGVILEAKYAGKNLISATLKPYQIEDYYQPRFVSETVGKKILGDVFAASWWD